MLAFIPLNKQYVILSTSFMPCTSEAFYTIYETIIHTHIYTNSFIYPCINIHPFTNHLIIFTWISMLTLMDTFLHLYLPTYILHLI